MTALSYAKITRAVDALVLDHAGNDIERSCYMVARAALLRLRAIKGSKAASEKAFSLADELATGGEG